MKCPRCGHARHPEDDECPHCGIHYDYVEKKLASEAPPDTPPVTQADTPPVSQTDQTKSMPDKIKTACPTCGQKYKVPPEKVGVKTKCKQCEAPFWIEEVK